MRRISTATKVTDKFGPGKHGFTNGNAVSGVPATDMEDVWFDHVQEEISGVVEGTGGTLDPNNRGQLLAAIQKLLLTAGHGQCRLSYVSATQIKLSPYNGNNLIINGVPQQIPAAGVTLANTGLAASTLYYVYAYMNAGTMTLEAVTTTRATGTNGVEQKSGDATRTLVGMIYTNSSTPGQFQSDVLCLSWFNQTSVQRKTGINLGSPLSFTNSAMAELSTSLRVPFLCWAGRAVYGGISGELSSNTSSSSVSNQAYMDGAAWAPFCGVFIASATTGNGVSSQTTDQLSEGLHTLSVWGNVNSGATGSIVSSSNFIVTQG